VRFVLFVSDADLAHVAFRSERELLILSDEE
jgi:hypothetical protein